MKRRSRFALAMITMAYFSFLDVSRIYASESLPTVSFKTLQGQINLNQYKGEVIYLDFWASWCGPCRKSFPWMNEMQQRYNKDGLRIVAVNLDQDPQLAKQFLAEYPANFTVAFDPEGVTAQQFKVQGMPSSYLIDRVGKLHSSHLGFKEKDTTAVETEIKLLLKK